MFLLDNEIRTEYDEEIQSYYVIWRPMACIAMGKTEEGRNSAVTRAQLRIGQFRIVLNLLDHTRPWSQAEVIKAKCPLSVERYEKL